jgi:hypothetical protein
LNVSKIYNRFFTVTFLFLAGCFPEYDASFESKSMCANYFFNIMSYQLKESKNMNLRIDETIRIIHKSNQASRKYKFSSNISTKGLEENKKVISRGYWCDDINEKEKLLKVIQSFKEKGGGEKFNNQLIDFFSNCDKRLFNRCVDLISYPFKECSRIKKDTNEWKECFQKKSSSKTSLPKILYEESEYHRAFRTSELLTK